MNDEEKGLLIADIKAQVIKELTGKDFRVAQDNTKALNVVYQKYRKALYDKYGVGTWAVAWDCVRKLAVFKLGKRYVRDLLPSEEDRAAEFAEALLNQLLEDENIESETAI
ncbi:hypothetical protein ACFFJY_09215 [Fictibacillus aquaticus]|uniref:Uncharacterized protein n=1 Tax=Fictibacillus aquaticus TaxID=2021314 RepID=A0A235FBZ1_9BACL|nr:hypothetical protein [Fictibacillus aquaticus]OYD58457.1 hypothetical protein CGZ90_00720 [Fictibacillus aquaticus]